MTSFPHVIDAPSAAGVPSPSGFYRRFWEILSHPQASKLVVVLALLAPLPALWTGWESDDLIHKLVLQYPDRARELGFPNTATPGGLFTFLDGQPGTVQRMVDRGLLPWWTHPEAKSSFLRPLTFVTHWLDYGLWPESPLLMHAHSLMWYSLLIIAVGRFFRTFSGAAAWGTLAALLYAMDDAHATPVGWIANRSAILTTLFGVLSVHAYQRTSHQNRDREGAVKESHEGRAAWITAFWLSGALLSGEGGAAAGAYLLAYALIIDPRPLRRRAASLLPSVIAVGAWLLFWTVGGYGTYAVGMYTNPFTQPGRYVWEVITRMPVILLGTLAFPPPDAFLLMTSSASAIYGIVAGAIIALLGVRTWRILVIDTAARFFSVGMVLAALLPCTTFPSDRNLMFVGLGAMGLVARIVAVDTREAVRAAARRRSLGLAGTLLIIHIVLAGFAFPLRASMPVGPGRITRQLEIPTDLVPQDPATMVVVLNSPSAFYASSMPVRLALQGKPAPHLRVLSPSLAGVEIETMDDHTIRLSPFGPFMRHPFDRIYRGDDWPLRDGEVVEPAGLQVTVEKVVDRVPASLRCRFDKPLSDPSMHWIKWEHGNFVPANPPRPGERLTLPPCIPK